MGTTTIRISRETWKSLIKLAEEYEKGVTFNMIIENLITHYETHKKKERGEW
jgi:predicted transcriptional regulator